MSTFKREERLSKGKMDGEQSQERVGWRKGIFMATVKEGNKEAVIIAEEDEERASAGWEQISTGDPLKLTRQCQPGTGIK